MRQYFAEMVGGSGTLRVLIQPTLAVILGILHGVRDKHAGRPPFLAGVIEARGDAHRRLAEGLRAIAIPICVAVVASWVFQYINRSRIHLVMGLLYAIVFVAIPYLATRGLANRFTPPHHPPSAATRA